MELSEREVKILRRETSYRRGRTGSLALALITFLVCLLVLATDSEEMAFLVSGSVQVCFWLALSGVAHVRLQHVDTLKKLSLGEHGG